MLQVWRTRPHEAQVQNRKSTAQTAGALTTTPELAGNTRITITALQTATSLQDTTPQQHHHHY